MTALIIAEHDNRELKNSTYHTMTCAEQLSEKITVLVIGHECQSVADEASKIQGVCQIISCDDPIYEHSIAEQRAPLISEIASGYEYVLAPASTFGKDLLPRVSALLDVATISDIVAVKNKDTFVRPIYAGNALATVQSGDKIKVITVRSTAFKAAEKSGKSAPVEKREAQKNASTSQFVKLEQSKQDRPELTTARVVVSGGRGLQSAENFKLIEQLADQLNAAIGASRAAVDAGFVPNDYQVGQTGKIVAPELYIAVGISGAIQHLAGMKDSKVVVAINKDPEAPIFSVATYGIVGDLFHILPQLTEALAKVNLR